MPVADKSMTSNKERLVAARLQLELEGSSNGGVGLGDFFKARV